MIGCTYRLFTALNLVVVLGTIVSWDSAASPVYRAEAIEVSVRGPVDFRSPGFPTCCDDKYIFYKVVCKPDHMGWPCHLHMVFSDVDMTAGSYIKFYENRRLIESVSQVGPVHKDTWYRPVVASMTGELTLKVLLVASTGSKRHAGFRATITRATAPGLQNWPDRPITTECPEAPPVLHSSVRMRMFSQEDRIHDCVWVLRGPENCTIYAATLKHNDAIRYEVHGEVSSLGAGSSSRLIYSLTNSLYVRVRKPVRAGDFEIYYGCYARQYERSTNSQECLARSIALYGGFECSSGFCVSGSTRCNIGIPECPNGADETECFNDGVTTGTHLSPSNMPPVNETTPQIVRCFEFEPVWGEGRLLYMFIILPIVMILWVACVCALCKRRRAQLRRPRLAAPTEGDPPPIYQIAIHDIKPELDVLASLPSYEEVCSPPDPPPKYMPCELTPVRKGTTNSKKVGKKEEASRAPIDVVQRQ